MPGQHKIVYLGFCEHIWCDCNICTTTAKVKRKICLELSLKLLKTVHGGTWRIRGTGPIKHMRVQEESDHRGLTWPGSRRRNVVAVGNQQFPGYLHKALPGTPPPDVFHPQLPMTEPSMGEMRQWRRWGFVQLSWNNKVISSPDPGHFAKLSPRSSPSLWVDFFFFFSLSFSILEL